MSVRLYVDQFQRRASRTAAVTARAAADPVYLVAMHGFLAHSGSFQTFFRTLSDQIQQHTEAAATVTSSSQAVRILCPDARNHGLSPHTPTHCQSNLIEDLESVLHSPVSSGYGVQCMAHAQDTLSPSAEGMAVAPLRVVALGHSMGSGTWGRYLMEHNAQECLHGLGGAARPVQVLGFVALDMPPITASQWNCDLHDELANVVDGMERVELSHIRDYRSAHDEFIRCGLMDVRMRGMCSTNLLLPPPPGSAAARSPGAVTRTAWKCNLPVLKTALEQRTLFFPDAYFADREALGKSVTVPVPVLSLLGGDSPVGADLALRGLWAKHAVDVEEHVIPGATHTIYFDRPKETASLVVDFLQRIGAL